MQLTASFGGKLVNPFPRCNSCSYVRFSSPVIGGWQLSSLHSLRVVHQGNSKAVCRVIERETEPESNNEEQQGFDESMRLPKETIDILRNQVFGFDTFFVTGQEPYEGKDGVVFKGNLRGPPAKIYEKIARRLEDRFGDQYSLILMRTPEDELVAVVMLRKDLQPVPTSLPEWPVAVLWGTVTIFTLIVHNVPALQTNLLSVFDNVGLLKNGLAGALVTVLILAAHEIGHNVVAKNAGIKLSLPFLVPSSWQIGSFGTITNIMEMVPKREVLLKIAAAGPLAGFVLGFVLLLLGFVLPPADGLGVIVDPSVFHDSFLVGAIAKLFLGDGLMEGTPISINPLVMWAWSGLVINALNSIPAGEIDGGLIAFSIWGRRAWCYSTAASLVLIVAATWWSDVATYWFVLIYFLRGKPIQPLFDELTEPDDKYKALGVGVLLLGLLVYLPYPFPFASDVFNSF